MCAPDDATVTTAAPTQTYISSTGGNRVTLSVSGDFLRIDVVGETLDDGIVGCFREALAAGTIHPNMMTLVDLSDFKGGIDWSAIHAIAGLAPWGSGSGPAPRVAFVTRSAVAPMRGEQVPMQRRPDRCSQRFAGFVNRIRIDDLQPVGDQALARQQDGLRLERRIE